jgi:signal transduction histidine kinase
MYVARRTTSATRPHTVIAVSSRSHATVVLTALGVALFQVVGSFGAAGNQTDRRSIDAVAIVLVLAGPAALATRDRWPLGAAAVSMAAAAVYLARGYPFGPIFVSVVVALFVAVQTGRRRETWLLAAAGYLAFVVAEIIDPRSNGDIGWLHWTVVAGWLVGVLAVAEVVRIRREQMAERERADAEADQRRVTEQRLELAQELHDVLAHNISLINVQASVALHLLESEPDRARPALAAIKGASHDALQELRAALDTLRTGHVAPRAPTPRLADLDELLDGVRSGGLDVVVEREGSVTSLPAPVELAAYRIVQEALTNVTRHAGARRAVVRIAYDDGVHVEVVDDGVGGDAVDGNGLRGMRERAGALGGDVEAGPIGGGGFRVSAWLPVPS